MIMIKKPNHSFLVVQPSQVNTEQNQTILPEMNTEVSVCIGEFALITNEILLNCHYRVIKIFINIFFGNRWQ